MVGIEDIAGITSRQYNHRYSHQASDKTQDDPTDMSEQGKRVTELSELTAVADGDFSYVVDVSDTTDSPQGTSRKVQAKNLRGIPQTAAETTAGVTPTNYQYEPGDIRRYGATLASADNSAAINNAITVANTSNSTAGCFIPGGKWKCTSNVVMKTDVMLYGIGRNSYIEFNGAKLSVDAVAAAATIKNFTIRDIQVSRIGTAGTAVHFEGNTSSNLVDRFNVDRLNISSSTGAGLTLTGGVIIGDFNSPLIRGCATTGIIMERDTATTAVACKALNFYGGELQSNVTGVSMNNCDGINFFGTVIEGNSSVGVDIERRCESIHFWNCWFEANGSAATDFEVVIGSSAESPATSNNIHFHGGFFGDAAAGKNHAIELVAVGGFIFENATTDGYATSDIANNESSNGTVRGRIQNFTSLGSTPLDTPTQYLHVEHPSDYFLDSGIISAAGAVSLTEPTTWINTSGAIAITLADGYEGQTKHLLMITDGGDATLTFPGGFHGPESSLVFNDVGDTAELWFQQGSWALVGGNVTRTTGAYTPSNDSTDRSWDANAAVAGTGIDVAAVTGTNVAKLSDHDALVTVVQELSDVVATIVTDLQTKGQLS